MEQTDVVIIGSGYGGSIPALRLSEAGAKVVVLERGVKKTSADLQQSDDTTYMQSVIDYVIGSSNIGFRTGKLLGGASINMDGAFFRTPTDSFEHIAKGKRVWPAALSRQVLDQYYPRVEAMLKIRSMTWEEIPKNGGLFAQMCTTAGASCDLALMNYTDCVQCGFCTQGCTFDKKMTLLHTYIPAAIKKGAEFRTGCDVATIEPSGTGYIVNYTTSAGAQQIYGDKLIVAGGGIHTPALLLRSRSKLPNLSEQVGENFNTNGEHVYMAILPEGYAGTEDFDVWKGMDNAGVMSFHYWESDKLTLHPGGGFEPSILGANLAKPGHDVLPARAFGLAYKRFSEAIYRRRLVAFSALGISPSHFAVGLKPDGSADVVLRDRTGHDEYLRRLEARVQELGAANGATVIDAIDKRYSGMTSAHLLAACRMAETKAEGVVDPDGRVFGYENLYICDASTVPYALGVNPSLTISAIAERASELIVQRG